MIIGRLLGLEHHNQLSMTSVDLRRTKMIMSHHTLLIEAWKNLSGSCNFHIWSKHEIQRELAKIQAEKSFLLIKILSIGELVVLILWTFKLFSSLRNFKAIIQVNKTTKSLTSYISLYNHLSKKYVEWYWKCR